MNRASVFCGHMTFSNFIGLPILLTTKKSLYCQQTFLLYCEGGVNQTNEGCTIEGRMSAFNKRHSLFTGPGVLTMRHLATLQPSVPAPSNRHFVEETASRSSDGISLHLISFRFRSTEDSASLGWEKISEPPLIL